MKEERQCSTADAIDYISERDLLASIVKYCSDAIIGKKLDGTIMSWNEAAERMYGFSAEQVIGQSILVVVPPDRKYEISAMLDRIRRGQTIENYETKRMNQSGTDVDVSITISPIKNSSGEIVGASTVARDISNRKRTEEALRRSSAYNRSLIEASLDPLVTISAEGKITDVNTGTERVTGYSRHELIGTDFTGYFTDPEKARAGYQLVFRDGLVKDYELEIRHKDGRLTPVMYNASVYRDEAGRITGLFAAARDISDRKQAEKALQAAGIYNRSLIEASLDPLVTISAEGKITDVNTGTERVTGFTRNELVGTDFADYFTEPEKARAGYQQVFRDGLVKDYELEIRHRDGGMTPVMYNASVYRDESGDIIGVFAAARDISARKEAEEALAKRNRDIEAILNANTDSVFLLSSDWTFVALNEATAARFGRPISDLLGKSLSEVLPLEAVDQSRAEFDEVMRTGSAVRFEDQRGGRIYFICYYPVLDPRGRVAGVAGFERDITVGKQAEIERERLIMELEAKNAELERFTYSVSHDLRSPLITIRTFLGFVMEQVAKGQDNNIVPDLERIDKAAERMGRLLGEILELSRVGRVFNASTEVPARELVDEVLELLSGSIAQLGVKIEIVSDLPRLYVDRARVSEVFQNLLENSMKFMGNQEHPRIEIGARKNGDETVMYVRDNGIGIEAPYHSKIFGLFNKLEPAVEGTGIGLALVKRIVEVHGGRIWVESEGLGKGASFCFTLPWRCIEG